jgi:antitoxin (DNA-binding transcriptional repressor) of toxin-antitoxin stability system
VPRIIAQRELRNQNAAIMNAVASGESFLIARNGVVVAELRPVEQARRTFVPKAVFAAVAAKSPHIDAAAFRADMDRFIDQQL